MVDEAPSPDVKRRRITVAESSPQGIIRLTDLPSGILTHAATFLAAPSKALFAVALGENSPNERSLAIVGNQWDILDFEKIEKGLAAKLTDDHIEKLLLCIDAVNNVKRLKLANCTKITGSGLEPLRGSLVIEQIDLSLVGAHESPMLYPEPPISCDHVLPILDSIIEREGSALMHLQFPAKWREEPSTESEFHAFIMRYNQMWEDRDAIRCLECNKLLPAVANRWICIRETNRQFYGNHFNTCYGCLKHYCYICEIDGEDISALIACHTCDRDYCVDCTKMHLCLSCSSSSCNNCYNFECHKCNEKFCSKCVENNHCVDCNTVLCPDCGIDEDGELCCELCSQSCCTDC